jgi:hypothetical protein
MKRSPLKAKREKPRRNEGRVPHQRTKPKRTAKTAEERRFHGLVANVPCLVCGRPAEVHHLMHHSGQRGRRDHRIVAPLCPDHHRGPQGVHGLGGEHAFRRFHVLDLENWATTAWIHRDTPDALFWRDSVTLWERRQGEGGGVTPCRLVQDRPSATEVSR